LYNVHELNNLQIPSTAKNVTKNLWLEIINANKKYIVGGIYRHPSQNIAEFNNLLSFYDTQN